MVIILHKIKNGIQDIIKPPTYFNTKKVLSYLSNKLNNISYQIRNLRDYFLTVDINKKPKNYDIKMTEF